MPLPGGQSPLRAVPHEGAPANGRFTDQNHPRTRLEPLPPRHARGRPVAGFRHASLHRRRCRRVRRPGRQRARRGRSRPRQGGHGPVGASAGRPVPGHERHLGEEDRDPGRQGVVGHVLPAARTVRPARQGHHRGTGVQAAARRHHQRQDRRFLQQLHGHRGHRRRRHQAARAVQGAAGRRQEQEGPGPADGQVGQLHRRAAEPGRRPRRQGSDDLLRQQLPGRPGPGRPRLLPEDRRPLREGARGLCDVPAHDPDAGRRQERRDARPGRDGAGDEDGQGAVVAGSQPRSGQGLQPDDAQGAVDQGAQCRLEGLPRGRRPARPGVRLDLPARLCLGAGQADQGRADRRLEDLHARAHARWRGARAAGRLPRRRVPVP